MPPITPSRQQFAHTPALTGYEEARLINGRTMGVILTRLQLGRAWAEGVPSTSRLSQASSF